MILSSQSGSYSKRNIFPSASSAQLPPSLQDVFYSPSHYNCPSKIPPLLQDYGSLQSFVGFPADSDGEESACNEGHQDSSPGSARSPGEGNSNLLQYSCHGKFHRQRSLVCYSPWDHCIVHYKLGLVMSDSCDPMNCI